MINRNGDWMQTVAGQQFWPLDPRTEDIHIEDIAHALSMQCRYGGHTKFFYSVAEHCIHVSYACSPQNALWGLLHDASEAYIQDVIRPIKPFLSDYKAIEDRVMACICERFYLSPAMPAEVKEMDTRILVNEYQQVMNSCVVPWGSTMGLDPLPDCSIKGYAPIMAKEVFLWRFEELTRARFVDDDEANAVAAQLLKEKVDVFRKLLMD